MEPISSPPGEARSAGKAILANAPARPRVLVVLGEGGHTTELLSLVDLLGPAYEYHYLIPDEDEQSAARIRFPGPVHRAPRPRFSPGKRHDPLRDARLGMRCFARCLRVMKRVRPSAIVTTGPWIGAVAAFAARILGIRVIFIETGARVTRLSATGRAMRFLADDFFVQWQELRARVPRARYAGRLW